MRPECLPTGENAGWNSAGACKNAGAGADCGGGLWTHSSPGYSGGAASWLRQCARLAAAALARRGAHPVVGDCRLWARLAELGAETLSKTLPLLAAGTAPRTPQDGTQATFAPMLSRELSPMDWSKPVRVLRDQVRGLLPWPCASAEIAGQWFKIYKTAPGSATSQAPGTVLSAGKKGIEIACGDGRSLVITELQAESGKRMSAAAYLLGHPMKI